MLPGQHLKYFKPIAFASKLSTLRLKIPKPPDFVGWLNVFIAVRTGPRTEKKLQPIQGLQYVLFIQINSSSWTLNQRSDFEPRSSKTSPESFINETDQYIITKELRIPPNASNQIIFQINAAVNPRIAVILVNASAIT